MKQKFVVFLFSVVFQSYVLAISVAQDMPSTKLECSKPFCSKIVCTGGTTPTFNSNGCPDCPICKQKPICKPPICPAVECPSGTTPRSTVLPNGCPGCRKCVKCDPRRCTAMGAGCTNLTPTLSAKECPCPGCEPLID